MASGSVITLDTNLDQVRDQILTSLEDPNVETIDSIAINRYDYDYLEKLFDTYHKISALYSQVDPMKVAHVKTFRVPILLRDAPHWIQLFPNVDTFNILFDHYNIEDHIWQLLSQTRDVILNVYIMPRISQVSGIPVLEYDPVRIRGYNVFVYKLIN